ncbi:Protein PRY2-like isoform X3 [Aphelenchoides besseyi]|nr:Protein PRY2-like isoform X3 [Aphelenchoides besseyi]
MRSLFRGSKADSQTENRIHTTAELQQFRAEQLRIHNLFRQKHGALPLVLDDELNRISQEWANKLAKDGRLSHRSNNDYGENVFYSSNNPSDATQRWYDELKTIGKKMDVEEAFRIYSIGHFTQIVWKETRKMGISFATDARGHFYVVANYHKPGNFMNSKFKLDCNEVKPKI